MSDFGVRPRGDWFLGTTNSSSTPARPILSLQSPLLLALGGLEKLNDRLFPWLNSRDLSNLSGVDRTMWTLVNADESNWKDVAIRECSDAELNARLTDGATSWRQVATGARFTRRSLGVLFSDALRRPGQCAQTEIAQYWIVRDSVKRVKATTVEAFVNEFEEFLIPVVMSGFEKDFAPGIKRWKNGLTKGLLGLNDDGNPKRMWRCGGRSLTSSAFATYTKTLAFKDESPLYIFDAKFAENFPPVRNDYQVPFVFRGRNRDFFEYLDSRRPDYRWVIAGAQKSGSKWHIDPNRTHAWNCSLLGSKKWLMLPPWGPPPPGVFPSPDGGDVAQPVSLIEWFMNFYRETRVTRERDLIEFVAKEGEVVFVPGGWWHAVLNLDESFAVTQNYVSSSNFSRAFKFFQEKPDQISGLRFENDVMCCGDDEETRPVMKREAFAKMFLDALPSDIVSACREVEAKVTQTVSTTTAWSSLVNQAPKKVKEGFSFDFAL